MTMPNFFIIGAQKAGTTSLYHYLSQHPQVYMSPTKEPFFFDHEIDARGEVVRRKFPGHRQPPRFRNIEEYRALFQGVQDERAIGEATPLYIYVPEVPWRLQKYAPDARAVALLRNPADRAYSAFLHAVRIGVEPLTDFAQALRAEEGRIRNGWHYIFHYRNRGLYHAQLSRYFEAFGPERVGVWLYEELREDPSGVARSVFRFLGVDDAFVPDTSSKHNPAGVPYGRVARSAMKATDTMVGTLRRVLPPTSGVIPVVLGIRRAVHGRVFTQPPPIDPEIRKKLLKGYEEDIRKLERLLQRDLSLWLEGKKAGG